MNRTTIAQLYADQAAFGGQTVTVAGWARTIRAMKNLGFLTLNDGSCFKNLQVVLEKTLANYDEVSSQNVGAAFIVTGKLVLTPDAKQPFELQAETVVVEGASAPDYPLQKKRHSVGEVKIKPQPVENLIKLCAGNGRRIGAQHLHEMGTGLAQHVSLPRRGAKRIVRDLRAEALFEIFLQPPHLGNMRCLPQPTRCQSCPCGCRAGAAGCCARQIRM